MVKEGMPGPEHVKKWAIRGGLASMEGKYVDLDSSDVRPGPGNPDSSMDLSNYFTNVHYFTNYST